MDGLKSLRENSKNNRRNLPFTALPARRKNYARFTAASRPRGPAAHRDRGESHLSAPPTPPDMRVRIRRFGRIELGTSEQPWNPKLIEVGVGKRIAQRGAVG